MLLFCHWPLKATSTRPGVPKSSRQQMIWRPTSVVGILGAAHHVAVLNGTPPSLADTICHGGTCSADGLEISLTPLDSVTSIKVVESDLLPSLAARDCSCGGPPIRASWGLVTSVTTEAFPSASRTAAVSR